MFKIFCMSPNPLYIYHPLFHTKRRQIKRNIMFWCFPISVDKTNNLNYFFRNRIRFCLPFIKYFFKSKIEKNIEFYFSTMFTQQRYFRRSTEQLILTLNFGQKSTQIPLDLPQIFSEHILTESFKYSNICFKNKDILFILNKIFKKSKDYGH